MNAFSRLIAELEGLHSTKQMVETLRNYFVEAPEADRLWALGMFSGKRPKRAATVAELIEWTAEITGYLVWLIEECRQNSGDLAETLSIVYGDSAHGKSEALESRPSLAVLSEELDRLSSKTPEDRKRTVLGCWSQLDAQGRFVLNKMISGGWRIGISEKLAQRALALAIEKTPEEVAFRLSGNWHPRTARWEDLFTGDPRIFDRSKPYPFQLANSFDRDKPLSGGSSAWIAEPKWDGIRVQVVKRGSLIALWSRGMDLISDAFPDLIERFRAWECDLVLDGELLAIAAPTADSQILDFSALQTRLRRKKPPKKLLEQSPVAFMAYDLLEKGGLDLRNTPFTERRGQLAELITSVDTPSIRLSPVFEIDERALDDLRQNAASLKAEGLVLKRKESVYSSGRVANGWYKYKLEPMHIDAVLIYATKGRGRRADQFTDYTFALWEGDRLLPFAKAYSGLDAKEIAELDRFIKANLRERFGPVYSVEAVQVFELAFESVMPSPRHKSGLAVRFPRIARWRKDKPASEANTLDDLRQLMSGLKRL